MSIPKVLITGGSGLFGLVFTEHFLAQGYCVASTCNSEKSLEMLTEKFREHGSRYLALRADMLRDQFHEPLIAELERADFAPNTLVNNARSLNFLKTDSNGVVKRNNFVNEYVLDVVAPYELTIALSRQKNRTLNNVINIGSMYGMVAANPRLYVNPEAGSPIHYGVAKAALSHLTKELSVRLAPLNIRVNCIAFGGIEGRADKEVVKRYSELCPSGRMLRSDEITTPIRLLADDGASGITGHTLVVDGGWSVW